MGAPVPADPDEGHGTGVADPSAHVADLVLSYDDASARVVADALAVEARQPIPKAHVTVRRDGRDVTIAIAARDAVTLRAAVNSYLRWARVAEDAMRAAADQGKRS